MDSSRDSIYLVLSVGERQIQENYSISFMRETDFYQNILASVFCQIERKQPENYLIAN